MFTPASLIAAATRASAPGEFSMSMTRSTATVGAATLPGPVRDSYGSWKSCGKRSSPKLPSFELAKSPAMKHGA